MKEEINKDNEKIQAADFTPEMLPMKIKWGLVNEAMAMAKAAGKWMLVFIVGTKPCFYKFYGSIQAAHNSGFPYIVINANQHYDDILTAGIGEFNLADKISIDLEIRGDLSQKAAELYLKFRWLSRTLKKDWPDVNVVPVVLGDTILAGIIPSAWMLSVTNRSINLESGLRSMAPKASLMLKEMTPEKYIYEQQNGGWQIMRNEPYPEQWDTFVSSAACEYHFAPIELNKQHLLREGYPEKNIFVIGNPVMDAIHLKLKQKPVKSIFEVYPQLENGEWIRMDIHRKENLTPTRLKNIVEGVKKLVEKKQKVVFIQMAAMRDALKAHGMENVFNVMMEKNKENFLFTDLWPEYGHVTEFFNSEHCLAALTDSGGVQEDMNTMKKQTITCRFSTDRPETVMQSKGNVLAPPISGDFLADSVMYAISNSELRKLAKTQKPLYGENVGQKFISIAEKLVNEKKGTFSWTHEALGLWQEKDGSKRYL